MSKNVVVLRKKLEINMEVDSRKEIEDSTQHLIELIIKSLVSHPEDISVRHSRGDKTTIFHVDCSQRVIGHILGSRGKTIDSIRNIVMAICGINGFRGIIEVPYYPPK